VPANPDLGQRLPTGADAWRYLPAGDVASPGLRARRRAAAGVSAALFGKA